MSLNLEPPVPGMANDSHPTWHPKITVYRLLVLSTTIGLGTAKAVATYQHKSYASTTLEWISGTAIFLVFFLVGLAEDDPSQLSRFRWLLDYDTAELIWATFKILSLNRPRYSSQEEIPDPSSSGRYPPVTGFRVLTNFTVILFGMTKAYLSYGGFGKAATAMDWTFGVAITSSLYCLGLYKNNTTNKMPYLFSTNYDTVVFSWGWLFVQIAFHMAMMTLAIFWSLFWHITLKTFSERPIDFHRTFFGTSSEDSPTFLGRIHDLSMKYAVEELMWFGAFWGPALVLQSLWQIISLLRELPPVKKVTRGVRQFALAVSIPLRLLVARNNTEFTAPSWAEGTVALIMTLYRFVRRFGTHIVFFTCAMTACAVQTFFFLGIPLRIFVSTKSQAEFIAALVVGIPYIFIAGAIGGGGCFAMLFLFQRFIYPFRADWNSAQYERTSLEF